MPKATPEPKAGEPCPQCGGAFAEVPAPTDAQRAAAANRENPAALPAGTDTATEDQLAELGSLFRCSNCGYRTRIKADGEAEAGNGGDAEGGTGAQRRRRSASA